MADPTGAYEKGKLYQLDLAHLQADPNQPRKFIDPQALEDLTESVRQHGVLVPILFREIRGHDPNSPELGIVPPNFIPTDIAIGEVAHVTLSTDQPLIIDSFTEINEMGRFVIESNNVPVACGIIL